VLITLTVLIALLAVAYVLPGSAKVLAVPRMQTAAAHFGIPWPQYRLLGVAELAAATGVLLGIHWPLLGILGASGMVLLLLGALIAHRRAGDKLREAVPALVVLLLTLAYLALALAR
jgi:hypothetical protein